jgi:8-oxo-dGTP diphosphatase/putative hydrolase of the HAD superfamily
MNRESTIIDRLRRAQWLFFDVGSTLLDEERAAEDQFEQASQALRRHGVDRSFEQFCHAYRYVCENRAPRQFVAMMDHLQLTPEQQQIVWNETTYHHALESLYRGVADAVRRLSRKFKLGIIANQYAGTKDRLIGHGVGDCFAACCGSAEAGVSKPDPRIFQHALQDAKCRAEDAVMIGDRLDNDVRPAKALGMMTVRVLTGPTRMQQPRSEEETPDLTVNCIKEFADALLL